MTKDYLERFSKRMELVAVVDSIVGRANKNQDIERLFSNGELDNILLSILVFIMEMTLTEERDCSIGAIAEFLADILPAYGKRMDAAEIENLARYLVKDLLQNKGETRSSQIMDYNSAGMRGFAVRLVADKLGERNEVLYELTKQGFDFLFRTKEVDDELGFELEAIRLRMLITKKNYKKATSQSKNILAMLLEKRNELRQFEQQLSDDIYSVSGEQYDAVVREVDAMLREEYGVMREIERTLDLARERLDEESRLYGPPDEKSRAARREIGAISANVQRALGLQRDLLIKCDGLRKLYITLLGDSLLFHQVRRFDPEELILKRMERLSFKGAPDIAGFRAGLFAPLFLPEIKRSLNLSLMYDRQIKLREAEADGVFNEDPEAGDGGRLERVTRRNNAHILVVSLLLEFAKTRGSFTFGDFWGHVKTHGRVSEMTDGRILFLDMLKLYETRVIDLAEWRKEGPHPLDCIGEFDLDYCLTCCAEFNDKLYDVERITVDKTGAAVTCAVSGRESVIIDDLRFEVKLSEADGENP